MFYLITTFNITLFIISAIAFQVETGMRVDKEINFTSTDSDKAITFTLIDDTIPLEPTEILLWTLTLITMRNGAEISPISTYDVQIVDDDGMSVCLQYTKHVDLIQNVTCQVKNNNIEN